MSCDSGMVGKLASGRTDALAGDFAEADQRMRIAKAIVSAAKSHVALGLTLRETRKAERDLAGYSARGSDKDWER